jgi:tetratricopeptide (TPR) repeat protein
MSDAFVYDVFVSYSSADRAVVGKLAERLTSDGLRVWFDDRDIRPGEAVADRVAQGLKQSRVMLQAMSANAFASDWVTIERNAILSGDRLNRQRRFIPVRLDDAPISDPLIVDLSYIDWRTPSESDYQTLLAACRRGPTPTEQASNISQLTLSPGPAPGSRAHLADAAAGERESREAIRNAAVALRGTRLGAFDVEDVLAVGPSFAIYRVCEGDQTFALKTIHPIAASWASPRSELDARLDREYRDLRILHETCAGLVPAPIGEFHIKASELRGTPYTSAAPLYCIAMRVVRGSDPIAYARAYRLDVRKRVRLVATISAGMARAHQAGVFHHGIRSDQILVWQKDSEAAPVVLGWGRASGPGTASSSGGVDAKALGALLYELVTEQPLADGRGGESVNRRLVDACAVNEHCDEALKQVIELAVDPDRSHFASALEIHAALEAWLAEYVPRESARPSLVQRLVKKQVELYETISLMGRSRRLREVFIAPQLVERPESEAGPGRTETVAVPQSLGAALTGARCVLIEADAGHGKSTLLRSLLLDACERWLASPAASGTPQSLLVPHLPLMIRCRDLRVGSISSIRDVIAQSVLSLGFSDDECDRLVRSLLNRLDRGALSLFVDGLDELGDETGRARVYELLGQLSNLRGGSVTATYRGAWRTVVDRWFSGAARRMRFAPPDPESLHAFARGWFRESAEANRYVTAVESRGEPFTQSPLLLTLVAIRFERDRGKLPSRVTTLLTQAVSSVFEERASDLRRADLERTYASLGAIATVMCRLSTQRVHEEAVDDFLEGQPGGRRLSTEEWDMAVRSGVLVATGGPSESYRGKRVPVYEFWHPIFRDLLAARALLRSHGTGNPLSFPDRLRALVVELSATAGDRALDLGGWSNVVGMAVEMEERSGVEPALRALYDPREPAPSTDLGPQLVLACLARKPELSAEDHQREHQNIAEYYARREGKVYGSHLGTAWLEQLFPTLTPLAEAFAVSQCLVLNGLERDEVEIHLGKLLLAATGDKDLSAEVLDAVRADLRSDDERKQIRSACLLAQAAYSKNVDPHADLIELLFTLGSRAQSAGCAARSALVCFAGGYHLSVGSWEPSEYASRIEELLSASRTAMETYDWLVLLTRARAKTPKMFLTEWARIAEGEKSAVALANQSEATRASMGARSLGQARAILTCGDAILRRAAARHLLHFEGADDAVVAAAWEDIEQNKDGLSKARLLFQLARRQTNGTEFLRRAASYKVEQAALLGLIANRQIDLLREVLVSAAASDSARWGAYRGLRHWARASGDALGLAEPDVAPPAGTPILDWAIAAEARMYYLRFTPTDEPSAYYFVLVDPERERSFLRALHGTERYNLKTFGEIVVSGWGLPPQPIRDAMTLKYRLKYTESLADRPPEPTLRERASGITAMLSLRLITKHEALDGYGGLLATDPQLPAARGPFFRILRELAAASSGDAVTACELAVVRLPDNAEVCAIVGAILFAAGRGPAAEIQLRHALMLDAGLAAAHHDLGFLLQETGRAHEALPHLRRAVLLKTGSSLAHFNLGRALHATGDEDGAERHLACALRLFRHRPADPQRFDQATQLLADIRKARLDP